MIRQSVRGWVRSLGTVPDHGVVQARTEVVLEAVGDQTDLKLPVGPAAARCPERRLNVLVAHRAENGRDARTPVGVEMGHFCSSSRSCGGSGASKAKRTRSEQAR